MYSMRGTLCPKCIFIGNLPLDALEEDVVSALQSFGETVNCTVKRAQGAKFSLGYGFVEFSTTEAAEAAINAAHVEVRQQKIKISQAYRNTTLHISNILSSFTENDLISLCRSYGDLFEEDTTIVRSPGRMLVYGRVHFKTRDDAEAAKEQLNGMELGESRIPLNVDWFQSKSMRKVNTPWDKPSRHFATPRPHFKGPYQPPIISVYVHYEIRGPVNEDIIYNVFSAFGRVHLVSIKSRAAAEGAETIERGYCFVHFEPSDQGKASAKAAVESSPIVDDHLGAVFHAEYSRNFEKASRSHHHAARDKRSETDPSAHEQSTWETNPYPSTHYIDAYTYATYGYYDPAGTPYHQQGAYGGAVQPAYHYYNEPLLQHAQSFLAVDGAFGDSAQYQMY